MINGIEAYQTNDLKKPYQKKWSEQDWGIAVGLRVARIPFDTKDNTVMNFIPQLYYEDDLFFLRGLEGGISPLIGDEYFKNVRQDDCLY